MALLYVTKASNLCISCLDNKKTTRNKTYCIEKTHRRRFVESCGFFPGTPVSSHKEYCRVISILKIRLTLRKLLLGLFKVSSHLHEANIRRN